MGRKRCNFGRTAATARANENNGVSKRSKTIRTRRAAEVWTTDGRRDEGDVGQQNGGLTPAVGEFDALVVAEEDRYRLFWL